MRVEYQAIKEDTPYVPKAGDCFKIAARPELYITGVTAIGQYYTDLSSGQMYWDHAEGKNNQLPHGAKIPIPNAVVVLKEY